MEIGVRDVLVLFGFNDLVEADAVVAGHCEVRQGGKDDDQSGDDVVETLALCSGLVDRVESSAVSSYDWNIPRHASEDDRRYEHDDEDNPDIWSALFHVLGGLTQCRSFDESLRHESLPLEQAFVYVALEGVVDSGALLGALTIVSSGQSRWPLGTLGALG